MNYHTMSPASLRKVLPECWLRRGSSWIYEYINEMNIFLCVLLIILFHQLLHTWYHMQNISSTLLVSLSSITIAIVMKFNHHAVVLAAPFWRFETWFRFAFDDLWTYVVHLCICLSAVSGVSSLFLFLLSLFLICLVILYVLLCSIQLNEKCYINNVLIDWWTCHQKQRSSVGTLVSLQ